MLCGCKMKTLLMESEWQIKAFETEWFGKLICVSYREQKVNNFIHNIVTSLMDSQKPLLKTFKWQKLVWFSHVVWHDTLPSYKVMLKVVNAMASN